MKKIYIILSIIVLVMCISIIVSNLNKEVVVEPLSSERDSSLSDIKFEDDKINIYLFWGEGCPHCELLNTLLESTKNKYGKYYNLYSFEVWNNDENGIIMDYFLEQFGRKTGNRSVPLLIVGDTLIDGYIESMRKEVLDAITSEYKDRDNNKKYEDVVNVLDTEEE